MALKIIRARTTDPETSHAAAASIGEETLRASQDAVIRMLEYIGESTDIRLVDRYESLYTSLRLPQQSPSGLRTRRKELVDKGIVVDTGKRVLLDSRRQAIVWGLA